MNEEEENGWAMAMNTSAPETWNGPSITGSSPARRHFLAGDFGPMGVTGDFDNARAVPDQ
jgi:hypothetical protein